MNIVVAMISSIAIKGLSAILEIIIQLLITHNAGVNGYGEYTFYVSLIEGAYFVLFSGSVKLNTFYLSSDSISLSAFKQKYVTRYVLPVVGFIVLVSIAFQQTYGIISGIILGLYYFAFDRSSVFFSRGYQMPALLGEYFLGRAVMLAGVFVTIRMNICNGIVLLFLYGIQCVTMLIWFVPFNKKIKKGSEEANVPTRKLIEFQASDIASSLISYSPTIMQFAIGGAFTAAFTGIIALARKFINFISGPTVKVFLPEFSRLYKKGDKESLQKTYLMIVRIQMVFIVAIGSMLIVFPQMFLHMFSPELEQYSDLFILVAVCLLLITGIGPVTGMLQMTGNEKRCNRDQWISIASMIIVWLAFSRQPLFAVYGICFQAVVEGGLKYYSVCKWFGKSAVPIAEYFMLWFPIIIEKLIVDWRGWSSSLVAAIICVMISMIWNALYALRDPLVKEIVLKKFQR